MRKQEVKLPPHLLRKIDYIILSLTVLVLFMLCIDISCELPPKWKIVFLYVDAGICFVFLAEFFFKLNFAYSKKNYIKTHFIDLISSIPFFLALRWGRIVRLIRILRVGVLFIKSANRALTLFAESPLGFVSTTCGIMIMIATFLFFILEKGKNPNVLSLWDALWWSIVTVTTVGYGDIYPATIGGRFVGIFLMIGGMGIFATFTAMIAAFLIKYKESKREIEYKEVLKKIEELKKKVEE